MSKAAEDAAQKITELNSQVEAQKAEKSQLDQELIQHKTDREAAKNDLAQAQSIRDKEHAQYVADSGDSKANIDALTGAIAALEKGMLKAMKDEMDSDLKGIIKDEETAQAGFEELSAAKKDAIAAASSAIESKTSRAGSLAVAIV